jgi:hypothetical protein
VLCGDCAAVVDITAFKLNSTFMKLEFGHQMMDRLSL